MYTLYFQFQDDFEKFYLKLKHYRCPHCSKSGFLILHGFLNGYISSEITKTKRGRRIFCNNRKSRNGCGRTFSILCNYLIKYRAITTRLLWRILKKRSIGRTIVNVHAMYKHECSIRTLYRLLRKAFTRQIAIRSKLTSIVSPPPAKDSFNQLDWTVKHLKQAFKHHKCPIAAFQNHFQTPFI